MKKGATTRALVALCRVLVVGDTCISEEGMAAIVGRDKRYHLCGSAHGFYEGCELIRKHQPDVLLIEPFMEDRDGIRSIKDLATEFPRIRILIVTSQSERIYAERALHAGAAGYWMKNGSAQNYYAHSTQSLRAKFTSVQQSMRWLSRNLPIVKRFGMVSVS